MSPDEVELPVSLADDLSTKPRTLRESVQHQWVRNMSDGDWRRLIAHYHGLVAHVDTEVGRMLDHLQVRRDWPTTRSWWSCPITARAWARIA